MKVVSNTTREVAPQSEPVTATSTTDGAINFVVPAGAPLGRAFDYLNILVTSALDSVEAVAMHEEPGGDATGTWSAVHMLQLARALLRGMHDGYIEHRRQFKE